jgi:hypothetical protein
MCASWSARSRRNSNKSEWIAIRITSDWFSQTEKIQGRPATECVFLWGGDVRAAGKFNLGNCPLTYLVDSLCQPNWIRWHEKRFDYFKGVSRPTADLGLFSVLSALVSRELLSSIVSHANIHVNAHLSNCVNDSPGSYTLTQIKSIWWYDENSPTGLARAEIKHRRSAHDVRI